VVPAASLTASLIGSAVFFDDPVGSDDALVLRTDASGNLSHNLFSDGAAGFESDIDLDSFTPGVQSAALADLQFIAVNTQGGSDAVTVDGLSASAPLEIDLANAEFVQINTGVADDAVTLSAHEGHLDVSFAFQTFHVIAAEEFVLDTGEGIDAVTVEDLSAATVPGDIDLLAEVVRINTGDADDTVTLSAHVRAPDDAHLDVLFGGLDFHVIGAQEFILDTQGGEDSITVEDLSAAVVPGDIDLIAETVRINTGDADDEVTLSAHVRGPDDAHLDVLFGSLDFHVIGASEFILDTQGGTDSVTVEDLSAATVPSDIDLIAETIRINTGDGDDTVTLSAHVRTPDDTHLDVLFGGLDFHVIGAGTLYLDTQGGFDSVTVEDLSSLTEPVDIFIQNAETITFNTGRGDDVISLDAHDEHLDVDFPEREFHVIGAQEVFLNTKGGDDIITINDLSSITAPALTINGGRGNDTYQIGTGNAILRIEDSRGTDTLDFSGFGPSGISLDLRKNSDEEAQAVGADLWLALKGVFENVLGSDYADLIIANGGSNVLMGLGGNDTLMGGAGNDWLFGGEGDDYLYGQGGNDFLDGGPGLDYLDGGAGDNTLVDPDGSPVPATGRNGQLRRR
jgi:Ca2+-binding RTX toxin-like protein